MAEGVDSYEYEDALSEHVRSHFAVSTLNGLHNQCEFRRQMIPRAIHSNNADFIRIWDAFILIGLYVGMLVPEAKRRKLHLLGLSSPESRRLLKLFVELHCPDQLSPCGSLAALRSEDLRWYLYCFRHGHVPSDGIRLAIQLRRRARLRGPALARMGGLEKLALKALQEHTRPFATAAVPCNPSRKRSLMF